MANVRGCNLPDELFYSVEDNSWARREADGTVTVGMTSYACSVAGQIVAYTPKKEGKEIEAGKSVATVESGKWVGPVKTPVAGEILEVNEMLDSKPGTINESPYGEGWLVKIRPLDWDKDAANLVTGNGIHDAFEAKMNADGFGGC